MAKQKVATRQTRPRRLHRKLYVVYATWAPALLCRIGIVAIRYGR